MDQALADEFGAKVPEPIFNGPRELTPAEIEDQANADNSERRPVRRPDSAQEVVADEPMFRIYEGGWGVASYVFDVWWSGPKGSLELRASDARDEYQLDISDYSEINVEASETYLRHEGERSFRLKNEPGVFSPIKFELWFKPADEDTERLVAEDIYMIQGWYR